MNQQDKMWHILQGKKTCSPTVKIEQHGLHCPYCDSIYLHQYAVEAFFINDGMVNGTNITMVDQSPHAAVYSVSHNMTENPSTTGRNGLTIKFWCEGCEVQPELTIGQHKGETIMKWKELV